MTEQEFLQKRKPVFVDPDSGLATTVTSTNLKDKNFAEIFSNQKIYWYTTNYIGFDTVDDLKKFKSNFILLFLTLFQWDGITYYYI